MKLLLVPNSDSCLQRKLGSERNKVLRIFLLFTVAHSFGKHVLGSVSFVNKDFQQQCQIHRSAQLKNISASLSNIIYVNSKQNIKIKYL
jgi:hypothetical protein